MRQVILLCFVLLCMQYTFAQTQRPYRRFATQTIHQQLLQQYPEWREKERQALQYLHSYQQVGPIPSRTIPIIFHIVYRTESERVSLAQVQSQIEALNRDFAHQVLDDHPALEREGFLARRPDSTGIHFCLAQIEVNGQTIPAIRYVPTTVTAWSSNHAIHFDSLGGANAFRPDQFLNVWVGNFGDLAGYAQMPALSPATDGIAIDYRYFGIGGTAIAPYNDGKTLTHLVGNYLGLYELWSEYGSCKDDYVGDTPIHSARHYGCHSGYYISNCFNQYTIAMSMNFMDNTDDACMYMFTYGQTLRMHATLSERGPRKLLTAGNTFCGNAENYLSDELEDRNTNAVRPSLQYAPNIQLQPNPSNGAVTISLQYVENPKVTEIFIYNTMGELVEKVWWKGEPVIINCQNWSSGIYIVQTNLNTQFLVTRLIITK